MNDAFDIHNISQADLDRLADALENYITELKRVMVIPRDIEEEHGDKIRESIHGVQKLIKKLRKGDTSVFKDPEEWNMLI